MQEVKFKQYRPNNKMFQRWNWDIVACLNFIEIIEVFVPEEKFQPGFVALSLLLQSVQDKNVQSNNEYEDENNDLPVNLLLHHVNIKLFG
jgi:hypothetical protein